MRLLFLSNTRANTNEKVINQLKSWITHEGKVIYFSSSPDPTRKYLADAVNWLTDTVGTKNEIRYVDAFSSPQEIAEIKNASALYLSGGNTYHLLQALRDTKAGDIIKELAKETETPIIGVSAGGLCLTKDIRAATADNNNGVTDFTGLGLVDFGFYPHYKEGEESKAEIDTFIKLTGIEEVIALPEYSGFSVSSEGNIPLGEVYRFVKGTGNPETLTGGNKEW